MQGVLVALGLIPLYKLCKHYKLNNFYTVIIGLIFIFHPSIIGEICIIFMKIIFSTL